MEFRKSVKTDADRIMEIIKQAQEHFKEQGIDQWQNNYPNKEVINNDIDNGESYVLLKDNEIVATTVASFNKEPTYKTIYEGEWITNDKYVVVHRVAVDNKYKGLGLSHQIFKHVEQLCLDKGVNSFKVDTHTDNKVMQNLLKKNGFKYCGIIYVEDGSERVAFEKVIK